MSEPTSSSTLQKPESLTAFLGLTMLVAVTLIIYGAVVVTTISGWQERGQFGDMFGAANTLFSGLAFSALVYALVLQRKELSLQRQELALTRGELSKQSEAQAEQAKTALRAAEISALGALLQGYVMLMQAGQHNLIDPANWTGEFLETKTQLWKLLGRGDA